jgi:hypothetical protein
MVIYSDRASGTGDYGKWWMANIVQKGKEVGGRTVRKVKIECVMRVTLAQ